VLSEDALRRIGGVDRDLIEQRIRTMFDRWARGDVRGLLEYVAPDVTIPEPGFWSGVTRPAYGRDEVAKALRGWHETFENIVSVLHEIVIDGDRAVVHRTSVGRYRDSGRRYQCDIIEFFRFRDGLVTEFSTYPDIGWSRTAD
jgi:ketosteroid isomerase-like protein